MAETNFRGPVNSMGSLEIESGTAATIQPFDGPSLSYQSDGWPDPRVFFAKDGTSPGRVPGFLNIPQVYAIDAVPQAANSSVLAAAQAGTAAVAIALNTVAITNFSAGAASIAVGVPLLPQGTTVVVTAIALDFGFTTGTTVAASSTVTVPDNSVFTLNQWIIIGNVANAAGTASLLTQVISIATSTTNSITVSPSPATALGAPIGAANLFGAALLPPATQFGPGTVSATYHSLRQVAGLARIMNPREMLARNISVSIATGAALTTAVSVAGYDVWGQAMTELITLNASTGVTTAWGKKAFKYVSSATVIGTSSGGTSMLVGLGDTFGFPFRADETPQLWISAGGTTITNLVGVTTAVVSAATNTSGDVRGTVQLSGLGAGTPISAVASSNNVLRLVVIQNIGNYNMLMATPNNLTPMFGTTQV